MTRHRLPLLRGYLLAAGALLLGQGAASLLARATGRDPHATTRLLSDPAHATVHLVWGVVLLGVLVLPGVRVLPGVLGRRGDPAPAEWVALGFGVFYVGLLLLGLAVHHPFGLEIDGPENAFHAVVGPAALIVWAQAVVRRRRSSAPARPVEVP